MLMKALVTGATHFIGSALIEELDTLGFEVNAILQKNSDVRNLKGLRFRTVEGDLSNYDFLAQCVREVDYVFHLAETQVGLNRAVFSQANTQLTERLARAVARANPSLSRFVFLSSLAAAGPASSLQKPRVETEREEPVSFYGESKLLSERELVKYRNIFPISIVRSGKVYGPRDRGLLLRVQAISRNFIPILSGSSGSGERYSSLIHVRDLCRGIVQAAVVSKGKLTSGEIFYLSGDGVYSDQDLIRLIAERMNRDPLKIKIPVSVLKWLAAGSSAASFITQKSFPLNWDQLREILPDYWICSNRKAKRKLGFVPEFDLESGLDHTVTWYKSQKWI